YRLYALEGAMPPKPALVRDREFRGPGIEEEVWAMPEHQFGSFVAGVPAPLGIGNAVMDDDGTVKSFICEPYAVAGATEITRFGGWRPSLSQALSTREIGLTAPASRAPARMPPSVPPDRPRSPGTCTCRGAAC